jgi:glutamate synthase (NADPH/NADH) large chain
MNPHQTPRNSGLYDPRYEHDACGVGFVVNVRGVRSHDIVRQALTVLLNLDHRGARGAESDTGDGAGILLQVPHAFLSKACPEISFPQPGAYGVGVAFLPRDEAARARVEAMVQDVIAQEGQTCLGWRTLPVDNSTLGKTAKAGEPLIRQVFIARSDDITDQIAFERKLYVIRRRCEKAALEMGGANTLYFSSFSSRTMVYKGMLTPLQVQEYFLDLADESMDSAICLVHSRFSTNTFPSWERAHPYRYLIHNGEINTIRGNTNWMRTRQAMFESELFGEDLAKVVPVIDEEGSDSAMFDNCLEFLSLAGRSMPHAVMMMIPEPWQHHETMSDEKKDFYHYHSCLMEPWDGPASIAFSDGEIVGAILDRNGLRPSRYYITKDDRVIMASEVGVLDIAPEDVAYKGRLEPGRMFLIDTREGRIIADEELKRRYVGEHPYGQWLADNLVHLHDLPEPPRVHAPDPDTVKQREHVFGYTFEDQRMTLQGMARDGVEPVGSMGADWPLAVLSEQPQLLYNYFKQLFAQVTNPPIDAIREELVTATQTTIGPERNLLQPVAESCRQLELPDPVLTNEELEQIRNIDVNGLRSVTIPILFPATGGGSGLKTALDAVFEAADAAIADGAGIIILSDRGVSGKLAPIPALLAVSGLHHHLIRRGTRTKVGIVLESGEPREVHHFALLIGYGAGAINPYLAYEVLDDMLRQGLLKNITYEKAVYNYRKACVKGTLKTMSKMGISTVQSYRGAQIFEALGIGSEVIDTYFTGTPSRIGGIGLDIIAEEARQRHSAGFPSRDSEVAPLAPGGIYQWRAEGESHLYNPETIYTLQQACRLGSYDLFSEYTRLINDEYAHRTTLRGLLEFDLSGQPVPLDEVEPVDSIVRRFKTGAMSYGSISQEAHETLAIAMNRLGGKSNTGEGGEDPARFVPDGNGDSRCSAIKQVASGRFGVTSEYLVNARELQIKMAQGAKPGEGGQLPGSKVYPWIARTRHSTPGVGLISPPPHHDIYSIEDLQELIHDLKNANRDARISVKLVSEVGVGTIAAGVAKAHADVILISGHDGGTGASPRSSIRHAGLPWELGLADTHQTLLLNDLRSRVVLETDGKLMSGRDVVIGALLGAEEFGFATAPLVVMGCVMMRVCNLDTCPVGVATQNPELRSCFKASPEHVENFMRFIAQQVREIMAQLGFRTVEEMVGRADKLRMRADIANPKAASVDLSAILSMPQVPDTVGTYCTMAQDHGIDGAFDVRVLLELCKPALDDGRTVRAELPVNNTDRVVGTIIGSEITRRYGARGLPSGTIHLRLKGSAGQSFGAFMPSGITLELEGDANDYIGKGLSGGTIIVYPPTNSSIVAEENVLIGNVAFYGATSGEAFIRGVAGERFCVRNGGMNAVVEAVGDHGCEYMTGGRVVVLGPTGRNFAAGMSGGVAYVYDPEGTFPARCNLQMVGLEVIADAEEAEQVRQMIQRHTDLTDSTPGRKILADWEQAQHAFVKVMPHDYRRMLEAMERMMARGMSGDEAVMAAFEANKTDASRVGGN